MYNHMAVQKTPEIENLDEFSLKPKICIGTAPDRVLNVFLLHNCSESILNKHLSSLETMC